MRSMCSGLRGGGLAVLAVILGIGVGAARAQTSAILEDVDHDPLIPGVFTGTLNPGNTPSGQLYGLEPNDMFLNHITGGVNAVATGNVIIEDVNGGAPGSLEIVGLAIHVADGSFSGSLSKAPGPLEDTFVNDLNTVSGFEPRFEPVTAYDPAYLPPEYQAAATTLENGELANGGQPFDIFAVMTFNAPLIDTGMFWGFDFTGELTGGPSGVTSVALTDVGAIPEPSSLALVLMGTAAMTLRRRRARPAFIAQN